MKICTGCKQELPLSAFGPRKASRDRLTFRCRPCLAAYQRGYHAARPGVAAERVRRSRSKDPARTRAVAQNWRDANRQKMREFDRRWRESNPEKLREKEQRRYWSDPDQGRARAKMWRQANPDKVRAMVRRRKALKMAAPVVETVNLDVLFERDGRRCHICGGAVLRSEASIDHLIPLSQAGDHTYANTALAHCSCNSRRGAGRIPAQLRLIG